MKPNYRILASVFIGLGTTLSLKAQSYQLNLQRGGSAGVLTGPALTISAAHEEGALSSTEDTIWNHYQLDAANNATGVLVFDQGATANNTLLDSSSGLDNGGVSFRYSEGLSNVDFSSGFTAGGENGAEDTGNEGEAGTVGNDLYTSVWFTRPGDLGHGFQFSGLEAGQYAVYVYATESNNTDRSYNVTFQADADSISSSADGIANGISTGNNRTAFVDGLNFTKQTVNILENENLVVFVSAEQNGEESFSSIGAIQIVEIPFLDEDNDMLPDDWEIANGTDPTQNDADVDNDANGGADGLTNLQEFQNNTDPQDSDSDDDGLNDGDEVNGTLNPYQTATAGDVASTAPGLPTNPLNDDSDSDGILDNEEVTAGADGFVTNPNVEDTDGDGLNDLFETTDRGNGTLDPTDSAGDNGFDGDPDNDTLTNSEELALGTDPSNDDTDEDGLTDNVETNDMDFISISETGTDPLNPDTDGDGLIDSLENPEEGVITSNGFEYFSSPFEFDSDGDGFGDGIEVEFESDPAERDIFPTFDPVIASLQFDFGTDDPDAPPANEFRGLYTPVSGAAFSPAHDLGFFGADDIVFNEVSGDVATGFSTISGESVPGISIDIGNAPGDETAGFTFDFGGAPEFTQRFGTSGDTNIYDTALMEDWFFSRSNLNVALRLKGLAQGSYRVIAMVREQGESTRVLNVSFGTQDSADENAPVVINQTELGVAGAPLDWTPNANFFSADIEIQDNDYIVLVVRGTDSEFASIEGLQILPTPETPENTVVLSGANFDGTFFNFTASGLVPNQQYIIKRSENLADGFPTEVGNPFQTAFDAPVELSDTAPPAGGRAFYRVELVTGQ